MKSPNSDLRVFVWIRIRPYLHAYLAIFDIANEKSWHHIYDTIANMIYS